MNRPSRVMLALAAALLAAPAFAAGIATSIVEPSENSKRTDTRIPGRIACRGCISIR